MTTGYIAQVTNAASFTGSISGNTMTVSAVTGQLAIGQTVAGGTTQANTLITSGPPLGGSGTYTVSISQTVASGPLTTSGWAVAQFMQAAIAQAPAGQTGWVNVSQTWPTIDPCTQTLTLPTWTVASNGSSVNWTMNVVSLPPAWAAMNLISLASANSQAKAASGTTYSGVFLDTSPTGYANLQTILSSIQEGYATAPYTIQQTNGQFVSATLAQVEGAVAAVASFIQSNMNARLSCIAAIQAGTITSSAQVLAAI